MNYGVRFYETITSCLEKEDVDIAIITTPMHIHYQEVMVALEKGILDLKKDILNNRFGKIKQIKTIVNWNRKKSYYSEGNWKGRQFSTSGSRIFENVMSNGTAHYFHNLLFLAGSQLNTSAIPVSIEGECYRGHNIETFDTTSIRMKTDSQCELLYLATFVSDNIQVPRFEITFENGKVYFPEGENMRIKANLNNGESLYYDSPEENRYGHFKHVVDYLHHGTALTCDINTTLPEILIANTVSKHMPVSEFPKELIQEDDENLSVKGISDIMNHCYERNQLFSEAGPSWAKDKLIIEIQESEI